jgi:hypothetical protein
MSFCSPLWLMPRRLSANVEPAPSARVAATAQASALVLIALLVIDMTPPFHMRFNTRRPTAFIPVGHPFMSVFR